MVKITIEMEVDELLGKFKKIARKITSGITENPIALELIGQHLLDSAERTRERPTVARAVARSDTVRARPRNNGLDRIVRAVAGRNTDEDEEEEEDLNEVSEIAEDW